MNAPVRTLAAHQHVWLIAAAAVLLRLPGLGAAPGTDEAGFLMVGRQWNRAGTSLYGNYWVDRPPVLITIFRIAAELGGVVPLRLIGCVATVLLVTGAARVARRLGGAPAALWAALVAAAWCVSAMTGSAEVNGELLAAPFVVWGIDALLAAITGRRHHDGPERCALWQATAAGALAVGALLVKQNFADVGIFAIAAVAVATRRGELTGGNAVRLLGSFAAGATAALVVVAGWTMLHGTSILGVYEAMYPFRIHAAEVMAGSPNPAPMERLTQLESSWVISGLGPVTVLLAGGIAARHLRSTAAYALVGLLTFDTVSVLLGGNYWSHYLMQLVTPAAILTGVLISRLSASHPHRMRALALVIVIAAVSSWGAALPGAASSSSQRLGRTIHAASRPGDTIITVYGHSDVSQTSGLASPYPYLWSLPLKTLDPHLHLLDHVLTGPHAPTWFVSYARLSSWGVDSAPTVQLVRQHYHRVAVIEGHTVYLRDGLSRATPALARLEGSGRRRTAAGCPLGQTGLSSRVCGDHNSR